MAAFALSLGSAALAIASLLVGCAGDGFEGLPIPNHPPDTRITAAPPVAGSAGSVIELAWTGSDPDGPVAYYQWRVSENGRDGMLDVADTLGLRWHGTMASDSVFTVSADLDSFPPDVDDPDLNPRDYRAWQTHTFFVRAVDRRGTADPTPAHVSFTATTLAPSLVIDVPPGVPTVSCVAAGQALRAGWTGADPDGPQGLQSPPDSVRTLWWEVSECYSQGRFEREDPLRAVPSSAWSPWTAYGGAGEVGRVLTVSALPADHVYFLAVQAKDRAGAVTPTLEWNVNVRHVRITHESQSLLDVVEPSLGDFTFTGAAGCRTFDVLAGQPLEFAFCAQAPDFDFIDGYRYGWDIADPSDPNDPGWAVPWGEHSHSGPHAFQDGAHTFVVQARNLAGTLVRGTFVLNVLEPPPLSARRPLLVLEDWPHAPIPPEEQWAAQRLEAWADLLAGVMTDFDPRFDLIDLGREPSAFALPRLLQYRAVLYSSKGWDARTRMHGLLAPYRTTARAVRQYNWFEAYQARAGNVLVVGPSSMYASLESAPPAWLFPVVFDASGDFPPMGACDSDESTAGRQRYPYSAFCLDAIDIARPPPGRVYGESGGTALGALQCDALVRARVSGELLETYPSAQGAVVDLAPFPARAGMDSPVALLLPFEEFYNHNRSARAVSIVPRPCQRSMFLWRARRDEGYVDDPQTSCPPPAAVVSPLDGAPCGVASTAHAATKPLTGSPDFVWGFDPLSFQPTPVRSALRWIAQACWQLPGP